MFPIMLAYVCRLLADAKTDANSGQKNVEFSQQKTSATHLNIHVFFQKLSYSLKINICLCVVSFESCYDFEQLLKEKEH